MYNLAKLVTIVAMWLMAVNLAVMVDPLAVSYITISNANSKTSKVRLQDFIKSTNYQIHSSIECCKFYTASVYRCVVNVYDWNTMNVVVHCMTVTAECIVDVHNNDELKIVLQYRAWKHYVITSVAKLFGHTNCHQRKCCGSTPWRSLDGKHWKFGTVLSQSLFANCQPWQADDV